jgi:hypothetical protein
MLFQIFTVHKDVIHEDHHKFAQEVTENCIHHMLKRSRGISEPKWHN